MENWNDQNFEGPWRNAFDGAEVTPSPAAWQMIDVQLLHTENIFIKKRVVFYQRMAAAAVGLLFLATGYFIMSRSNIGEDSVLTNKEAGKSDSINPTSQLRSDQNSEISKTSDQKNELHEAGNGELGKQNPSTKALFRNSGNPIQSMSVANLLGKTDSINLIGNVNMKEEMTNGKATYSKRRSVFDSESISAITLLEMNILPLQFKPNDYSIAYRLADLKPAVNKSKKKTILPERNWASVGLSAGNYLPSTSPGELAQTSMGYNSPFTAPQKNVPATIKEEKLRPGTSTSFAVSAGKRIFKRWILQGGFSYMNQSSSTHASTIEVAPANQLSELNVRTYDDYSNAATNAVTYATPHEIKSTSQFISIPLQAGYMVMDRKFGIQLNGGVAPDFFLRSSLYDQGAQTTNIGSVSGSNETYRKVSLAGLGGLEMSYRFSRHYRVSLAPGFRYSFTPVYKKEYSLSSAKQFVADIGIRVRYLFQN